VEVTDRNGAGVPELRPADRDAEGGRGLQLVAGIAARWGWRRRGGGFRAIARLASPPDGNASHEHAAPSVAALRTAIADPRALEVCLGA